MRDNRYIDLPGTEIIELPPLLVSVRQYSSDGTTPDLDSLMPEVEDMLPAIDVAEDLAFQRKFDLAAQLVEQYRCLCNGWQWGDHVLEWVRQCEITFEAQAALRRLLHPDVWPHASRVSFVTLLQDKRVPTQGVVLERAVGLRLTFRQLPPVDVFSNQFLFYLNSTVAETAYRTWSNLVPENNPLLPPERFHFDILDTGD